MQPHSPSTSSRPPRLIIVVAALVIFTLGTLADWQTPVLRGATPAPAAYLPLIARPQQTATPTATPTSITSSTATPTSPPTLTATPTSTATSVPPPCKAVYPIALNASLFDANGFAPPTDPAELPYYVIYNDATYSNKTQRRVFRTASFAAPGLDMLSWKTSQTGSIVDLTAALTGTGTLAQGFQEVTPWPDPNTTPPPGYPLLPGQLSDGDWIAGSSASLNSIDVRAALDAHVVRKAVMALPIIDQKVGAGQNTSLHFARLGAFLLRGYALAGGSIYFDLVYLGPADAGAPVCS